MSCLQFWNLTKSTCWMLFFVMTMKLGFPRVSNQFCFFSISEETIWVLNAQNIPWSCNLRTHKKTFEFLAGRKFGKSSFCILNRMFKEKNLVLFPDDRIQFIRERLPRTYFGSQTCKEKSLHPTPNTKITGLHKLWTVLISWADRGSCAPKCVS